MAVAPPGVFGFLINLPVVSYYEIGTNLTANHAHAAFMGRRPRSGNRMSTCAANSPPYHRHRSAHDSVAQNGSHRGSAE